MMSTSTQITDCVESIHLPAAWGKETAFDLLQISAGRAYVCEQLGVEIASEHSFKSSRQNCDSACYDVYEDGSLWFANNAEDEVWIDYRDFVTDSILPGLRVSSNLVWDESETDDLEAVELDEMDKALLLLFHDGDEAAAREELN
jgi:hypothetical protein